MKDPAPEQGGGGGRVLAVRGSLHLLAAEAVMVAAGIAIAVFLSRSLSLRGYGEFVLIVAIVMWVELGIAALFGRTTWQLIAAAEDWKEPAATIAWLHVMVGLVAGAAMFVAAPSLTRMLGVPDAVTGLRVLSAGIPLSAAATAHRQIAIGLGLYRYRALTTVTRTLIRFGLVLLLVQTGLGVTGALAAHALASLVELAVWRVRIRPAIRRSASFPPGEIVELAGPLFVAAVAMRLFERADLLLLQLLRDSTDQSAVYGAAQQLASLPLVAAAAIVPVLSGTLASRVRQGRASEASDYLRTVTRVFMLLAAPAAIAAGSGQDIMTLVYGAAFAQAGSVLGPLLLSGLFTVQLSIATVGLIISGRAGGGGRTAMNASLLVMTLALIGHMIFIRRWGMEGAAWVSAISAGCGALVATIASNRTWAAGVGAGVWIRVAGVCASAWVISRLIVTDGWLLLAELVVLVVLASAASRGLGALSRSDVATLVAAILPSPASPAGNR
ncbi:MAG: lipopolysaccharide biosynthesis protein [Gemmatimonadota bacterium]